MNLLLLLSRNSQAQAPQPQVPDDLLGAIGQQFQQDAQLTADIGNRIYLSAAGDNASLPYCVVIDESHADLYTSTSTWNKTTLRLRISATDMDTAGPIGDHVEAALKNKALAWTGGYSSILRPAQRQQRQAPNRAKGAAKVFTIEVAFECRTKRTLGS